MTDVKVITGNKAVESNLFRSMYSVFFIIFIYKADAQLQTKQVDKTA